MTTRDKLKRTLEASGCEILDESDGRIIASCGPNFPDIPKDVNKEVEGNRIKLNFDEEK